MFREGRRKCQCGVCGEIALENINFHYSSLCENRKFLKDSHCKLFQLFFSCLSLIVSLKLHNKQHLSLFSPEKFVQNVPFLGVLIILPADFDIFSVSNFSLCYIIFQNIWNSTGRHYWNNFLWVKNLKLK